MIESLELKRTEDDISIGEREEILEELAKEKGYSNYQDLKDERAKQRGFRDWEEYQEFLIRKYNGRKEERKRNRLYVFFNNAGKIHPAKLEKYISCGLF
jgi:hypothetical protein